MASSRRKSIISARALQNLVDKGVGAGEGPEYRPLVTTENMDSSGHSGKYECPLTHRLRHFLSEIEEGLVLGALRDPKVTDVRENFVLATGLTEKICAQLGIQHPQSTGAGKPLIPFTTDLLVSRQTPPHRVAFSGKKRSVLRDPKDRARRTLLVEHVYWSLHEVPFLVVTDLQITKNTLDSLNFLRPEGQVAEQGHANDAKFLRLALRTDWSAPLTDCVRQISAEMRIQSEVGMRIFKYLVWRGRLACDLERGIGPESRNAISKT
jgi:hypothetical protein